MAIRLRQTEVGLVALCAAKSVPKDGDIYLDDTAHHALSVKFDLDFASEGRMHGVYVGKEEALAIEREESNNSARKWWDVVYGNRQPVRSPDDFT